ncbi:MAG: efflux RND transporter periplasmic adaptor subunit [Pirellulales bacterium]|nr:efflux RND transporter periplasmic adaptor subunit [Pirellulales bacterium]
MAAALGSAGCHEQSPGLAAATDQPPKAAPQTVMVINAGLEPWPRTVTLQGSLLPHEDAIVGSKIAGRVESVAVDLGSVVKQGDPLVLLDCSELDLRVELAEAQLNQATSAIGLTPADDESKVQYTNSPRVELEQALVDEAQAAVNRARQLLSTRAVTGAEYDTLVAQLKAAQARYDSAVNAVREQIAVIGVRRKELALARQQVADAQIVAPFDGVVDERRVAPGEYVQLGQPVVTLVRADRLRFTAGVPESKARPIAHGQRVEIRVAGRDEPISTTVTRVSPTVTQTSRAVRIEADVPNDNLALQAGLFAEADIVVDPGAQALSLPASAVSRFAGVQKVWLVADGQARQQTVRVGREEPGRVEIIEGLKAGDEVVVDADQGHDGPVIAMHQSAARPVEVGSAGVSGTGGL